MTTTPATVSPRRHGVLRSRPSSPAGPSATGAPSPRRSSSTCSSLFVLLLMTGLLGGALTDSPSGYIEYVVPGVLAVRMLFGVEQTLQAITTDATRTITDRLRSLPIHAAAIVGGRCLADLLAAVLGLGVTLAGGLALGWRPTQGPGSTLAAVALLLWLRVGCRHSRSGAGYVPRARRWWSLSRSWSGRSPCSPRSSSIPRAGPAPGHPGSGSSRRRVRAPGGTPVPRPVPMTRLHPPRH